jgi:hypothetical protein
LAVSRLFIVAFLDASAAWQQPAYFLEFDGCGYCWHNACLGGWVIDWCGPLAGGFEKGPLGAWGFGRVCWLGWGAGFIAFVLPG